MFSTPCILSPRFARLLLFYLSYCDYWTTCPPSGLFLVSFLPSIFAKEFFPPGNMLIAALLTLSRSAHFRRQLLFLPSRTNAYPRLSPPLFSICLSTFFLLLGSVQNFCRWRYQLSHDFLTFFLYSRVSRAFPLYFPADSHRR